MKNMKIATHPTYWLATIKILIEFYVKFIFLEWKEWFYSDHMLFSSLKIFNFALNIYFSLLELECIKIQMYLCPFNYEKVRPSFKK